MSNQPETSEEISKQPETGEEISNQPEAAGNIMINPQETTENLLNQPETSDKLGNPPETTGEQMPNPQETTENKSNPPETTGKIMLNPQETTKKMGNPPQIGEIMVNPSETTENILNQTEFNSDIVLNPLAAAKKKKNSRKSGKKISNPPETGEIILNPPETTKNMSNPPETTEKMSTQPQTNDEKMLNTQEIIEKMSIPSEIGKKMGNSPETNDEKVLNPPETSDKMLNPPETTKDKSNPPETTGKIMVNPPEFTKKVANPQETTEKMGNPSETGEKKSSPPVKTGEIMVNPSETTEKKENQSETSEKNAAPGTPDKTSSTSTPKPSQNRRFKEPKKLLITAKADEGFPDFTTLAPDKKDKGKKEDPKKKAVCKPHPLRFLKLSPSHTWVWYEFGDSLVDAAVQRSAYDMGSFMLEYCPQLRTRLLPRRGWQLLRRNLGKARRFSPGFIQVELQEMERSRHLVRLLQQGKPVKREDHSSVEQIYKGVALPLTPDAKVAFFLRGKGILSGVIIRFNPEDSTYLVKCTLNGENVELTLPDVLIQATVDFVGLPLAHLMKSIDPNEDVFKMETITSERGNYSDELLEAIMQVRKLLVVKRQAVAELAAKNDSQQNAAKPKKGQASNLGSTIMALYRVNNEVVPPMRILHEFLSDYRRKIKIQQTNARSVLERYLKCSHRAETDLQTMEKKHKLMVKSPVTRSLYLDLQTILYLTGELGCPNTDDIMLMTDNLIAYMIKNSHPEVSAQLEISMSELKPLRQRMATKLKKKAAQRRLYAFQHLK